MFYAFSDCENRLFSQIKLRFFESLIKLLEGIKKNVWAARWGGWLIDGRVTPRSDLLRTEPRVEFMQMSGKFVPL